MKAIGIYYSKTGNTLKGLEKVKEGLESSGVDVRLIDVKNATQKDIGENKIVIIGSPVHGGNAAKPIRKFLQARPAGSMSEKICGIVSSAGTGKTDGVIKSISEMLQALGAEKIIPGVG
jgi:flavodoxin